MDCNPAILLQGCQSIAPKPGAQGIIGLRHSWPCRHRQAQRSVTKAERVRTVSKPTNSSNKSHSPTCRCEVSYLGWLGTGLSEVHELAQSQGVQAGDVKLHFLARPAGQARVACMHQGHSPFKLISSQSVQSRDQCFLYCITPVSNGFRQRCM